MQSQAGERRQRRRDFPAASVMLLASIVISLIAPVPVAAQIANGLFENNPVSPFAVKTAPGFIDTPNWWQVTTGSVKVGDHPGGTPCRNNGHCVALNVSGPSRLAQVLPVTIQGQQCTVTFWMSRDVTLASGSATVQTWVNNAQTATFSHSVAGVSATNGHWEQHGFVFNASPANVIAFSSNMPGTAGPQIDDVTSVCIKAATPAVTTGTLHNDSTVVTKYNPWKWRVMTLADGMAYQAAGGRGGSYTLRFQPSAALTTQLSAYIAELHAGDQTLTTVSLEFKLWDANSSGDLPGPATALFASLPPVTWSWTGGSPAPSVFNGGAMQPNHWYTIKTRAFLNNGKQVFPDSPANGDFSVRVIVLRGAAANAPSGSVLQIRTASGESVERPVR